MPKIASTDNFIKKSQLKFQNKFDYSKVYYIDYDTKINLICDIHGYIETTPAKHLNSKTGCRKCGLLLRGTTKANNVLTHDCFIKQSKLIHNNFYIYDNCVYKTKHGKVVITCPVHGDFSQIAENHLKGHGCQYCSNNALHNYLRKSPALFILQAGKVHSNKYTYNNVAYQSNHKHVNITCLDHGDFPQTPANHLAGYGCPKCGFNISKKETLWLNSLNIKTIKHNVFIKVGPKRYKVDGHDETTNTVYEFWGDYWHGNPAIYKPNDINKRNKTSFGTLYKNTLDKINNITASGYNFVQIWEYDWDLKHPDKRRRKPKKAAL
jgi:hypothetical protein